MKAIVLIIYFFVGVSMTWGQIDAIVNFSKSDAVQKTKGYRFSIYSSTDTLVVFNSIENKDRPKIKVPLPSNYYSVQAVFEYTTDLKEWQQIEYPISLEKDLKRMEIEINFSVNDKKVEFLKDLTVNKYYSMNRVSLMPIFEKKIGEVPIFILVSNCDTIFWGASETNHFYGTIKSKVEDNWFGFSGSYCLSTANGNSLHKSDTVYSWVPSYSPGNEYKIQRKGDYKYTVAMGLESYSNGIPIEFIKKGQTRKRTVIFYEVETEFTIE